MANKIESLVAFISQAEDGDDGLMAFRQQDGTWIPLVASDRVRIESLIGMAELIKKESGQPYKIVRFSGYEDITEQFLAPSRIN